jgi:hypothetical protein
MKRFLIAIALTCVLSVAAMAGEVPIVPAPSPGGVPTNGVSTPGDIPSDGSAAPADGPTLGLAIMETLIGLAF